MCLLLVAYERHREYRMIVAANRDEYYQRPAAAAAYWEDRAGILGGRDLQGGGTWLAVNQAGAFAAITNVRLPTKVNAPRSRGLIVNDFLNQDLPAFQYIETLVGAPQRYEGFNLLLSDASSLVWYSNRASNAEKLVPGVYALSNDLLDTPWPKVTRIKDDFLRVQSLPETALIEALFSALANEASAPDEDLPDTGVGLEFERRLSPIFITGDAYGTRCSTIVLFDDGGQVTFIERRFGPNKAFLGESSFKFDITIDP